MNSWLTKIDSLKMKGSLLHGWGTLHGSGDPPTKAWFESHREVDGNIGRIPVIFGKHNFDRSEGAITIEFVIYGDLQRRPDARDAFFMTIEWPNNQQMHLAVPPPRDITPSRSMWRITALPWKHYIRRGIRLVHQGQWSLLIGKVSQLFLSLFSRGWTPARLLKSLEAEGKPLALVVDHDLGGGANLYRRSLLDRLVSTGFTPVLLTAHHGVLAYQLAGTPTEGPSVAHVEGLDTLFEALSCADFKCVVFNNIVSFPEPLALAKALANWLKIKQIKQFLFLMHDHYCICPSWLLLNDAGNYCGIPCTSVCSNCLPANTTPFLAFSYGIDIISWRKGWEELLNEASEIRCFSNTTRALLLRAHGDISPERVSVVPHSLDHVRLRKVALKDLGWPVIGVIGHISRHKGGQVIHDLAKYIQVNRKRARIVVVGSIDFDLPKELVTVTGPYQPEQLPELIEGHGINVGFFPSICPETFSYVTEEMIVMGLPTLSFDLGAPGERIAQYAYGLVIPLGGPQSTHEALETLYRIHVARESSRVVIDMNAWR